MSECCQGAGPERGLETPAGRGEGDNDPEIWKIGTGFLLTANTMVLGLAISSSEAEPRITLFIHIVLLSSVVLIWELLGRPMWRAAMGGLQKRKATFELFFLVGSLAAVLASIAAMATGGPVYFEVAALLVMIYALGGKVGAFRRRQGLAAARAWAPEARSARLRGAEGRIREVRLEAVRRGDRVVVSPGEMIPVDGVVEEGIALVREAEMTGVSFSRRRRPGDLVFAGTLCIDGILEVRTREEPGSRKIDVLVRAVEQAWRRPSRWQEQAEAAIQWFVPFVLLTTGATFFYWTMVESWAVGLYHALAVLLVACPCALGFAIPLAVWATMGKWASQGLIPRHGQAVETLSRVDAVVFDKTGTLTEREPEVLDFVVLEGEDERRVREMVAAVEELIEHPMARALRGLGGGLLVGGERERPVVKAVKVLPGLGVRAHLWVGEEEVELSLGSELLVDESEAGILERLRHRAEEGIREGEGRRVAVLLNGRICGLATISEGIRRHVGAALEELRELGLETGLLTGDREILGASLDWAQARMTPESKHQVIQELQRRGKTVLFVGDGVNDGPAMAQSDAAICVAGGADLADEIGDLRWTGEDLRVIPRAIRTARDAFAATRFNVRFAVIYNVAGIAVAAAGLLHPVFAALMMLSSSLFVTWRTTAAVEAAAKRAGF